MILAGGEHASARTALPQRARIERLQESGIHLLIRRSVGQGFRQAVRNEDAVVARIEAAQIADIFREGRKQLPAQSHIYRDAVVHLPFVLRVSAVLESPRIDLRAGDGEERGVRHAQKSVSEGTAGEDALVEGEQSIVVRRLKEHQVLIIHSADVRAKAQGVLAHLAGEVIGEFQRLGLSDARSIASNGSESAAVAKIEGWEKRGRRDAG